MISRPPRASIVATMAASASGAIAVPVGLAGEASNTAVVCSQWRSISSAVNW